MQWIGYACSYIQSDGSWRVPLSIQCLGGAFLFVGSFITPRSVYNHSHDVVLMSRFLVDTDREVEGLRVIADFQGKPLDHEDVLLEYKEIRDAVLLDVSYVLRGAWDRADVQRAVGDRSYTALWRRYRARVLIAMSSQAFAQLVSYAQPLVTANS
jgi:hypothetical protein